MKQRGRHCRECDRAKMRASAVLIGLLVCIFFFSPNVSRGETMGDCFPAKPTAENVYRPKNFSVLWNELKTLLDFSGDPPIIVRQNFTRENIPDKRVELSRIGGCYANGVVQVQEQEADTREAYFLLHELSHYILERKGVDSAEHHCIFASNNLSGVFLKLLSLNGYTDAKEYYRRARINEIGMCDE